MRRCSAAIFESAAGARGGGTGTAALKGVLSCGSIAAQADRRSATTPAAARRAPGPELFFVRLEPAMLAENPIRAGALSWCRGACGCVLPLPRRLHLVRVRDLDLRSEADIEKSPHADGLAGQARKTRISRLECFAVAWQDGDRKIPALAWPKVERYARPPAGDPGNPAFDDNGRASLLGEGQAVGRGDDRIIRIGPKAKP